MKRITASSFFMPLGCLFAFGAVFLFGAKGAKAITFSDASECVYNVNINKGAFSPGENIIMNVDIACNHRFNSLFTIYLYATVVPSGDTLDRNDFVVTADKTDDKPPPPLVTYTLFNTQRWGGARSSVYPLTISAPSSLGNYKVILTTKHTEAHTGVFGPPKWVGNCYYNGSSLLYRCINFYEIPFAVNYEPIGAVDGGNCNNGAINIWGWALDQDDLSTGIPVHFYEGAAYKGQCATDIFRLDVNSFFGATGDHGFNCAIAGLFSAGNHTITAYGINTPPGNNPALGSVTVNCPAAFCNLPWGGTIANGASVTAYQYGSVPCGSNCAQETRTCNNGILSGSYASQNCEARCNTWKEVAP